MSESEYKAIIEFYHIEGAKAGLPKIKSVVHSYCKTHNLKEPNVILNEDDKKIYILVYGVVSKETYWGMFQTTVVNNLKGIYKFSDDHMNSLWN